MHERMERTERVDGLCYRSPTGIVLSVTDEQSKFEMLVHENGLRSSIMASAAEQQQVKPDVTDCEMRSVERHQPAKDVSVFV